MCVCILNLYTGIAKRIDLFGTAPIVLRVYCYCRVSKLKSHLHFNFIVPGSFDQSFWFEAFWTDFFFILNSICWVLKFCNTTTKNDTVASGDTNGIKKRMLSAKKFKSNDRHKATYSTASKQIIFEFCPIPIQ